METQQASLRSLLHETAGFHGGATVSDLRIGNEVLEYIFNTTDSSMTTLETGSGFTTAVFAMRGCRHTAIAPFKNEFERIKTWCTERNISCDNISFIDGKSQEVLPRLMLPKLDMVVLDGAHEFPMPYVDFAYTYEAIKVGGRLVVDDLPIASVAMLAHFLNTEQGRWKAIMGNDKTMIFEKLCEFGRIDWFRQPFNNPQGTPQ